MKDLYAVIRGRQEDKDKIPDSEVIKFCAQEATKARAAANPRPTPALPAGPMLTKVQPQGPGVAGGGPKVLAGPGPGGDQKKEQEKQWAQWGKVLADQQRMVQFQQMLAMAPSLPNFSTKVGWFSLSICLLFCLLSLLGWVCLFV